ncbi:MAG: 2-oxoglutarate dehydrogenase E2 component (dihydrolipoamide succinyltransferase) [Gammaproteobacteria bacterium]|jgi:2-oxoglutarate dehydrogenase E2 component (dihydrolipoamide succinyltransferase)
MQVEIKVPALPESVTEGTLGEWHKKIGDQIVADENIVDLETDKVVLEIVATSAGVLESMLFETGATVKDGDILGVLNTEMGAKEETSSSAETSSADKVAGPAARKAMSANNVSVDDVEGSGNKGRVTKQDVFDHVEKATPPPAPPVSKPAPVPPSVPISENSGDHRNDRRVPMSRLRSKVAERLKLAQNSAALLTTFNEVNLKPMMDARASYKDSFEKTHGVKLGMMSFFTRASVEALKRFPAVNASIDGSDIVYHDYFDIGIAVSSERGLVVPILRDADQLSYADIEKQIRAMGERAQSGKLGIDELTGGTFSITNGGIFGSMLSTPILNPPQSAILGMHSIQQRAVVIDGEIVIRPMMYLALTYDHRIIDGKDAVQFLVTIKNVLEDPNRLLLAI